MTENELADYLQTGSFGTVNVDLFYDHFPPDPDVATCVMGYSGAPDEPDGQDIRLEFPRFQVMTRGVRGDSNGPKLRALQVRAYLVRVVDQPIGGVHYASISSLGPPFAQGEDEQFRHVWSVNFEIMKDPSLT